MNTVPDRVLVGTSRCLFLVDVNTGRREVIDKKHGLYYGITWDESQIYVGSRWYPWYMPTSHIERPRLITFDSRLRRTSCREFSVSAGGIHQAAFHDGKLYLACSREDGYVIMDGQQCETWYPSDDPAHHGTDVHHFNSIWFSDDRLYLVAHNNGPSEVWEFTYPQRELVRRHKIGKHVHNIWPYKNGLGVCNSSAGRLETLEGEIIVETGGFPRGVSLGEHRNVIGVSAKASRSNRWLTIGVLKVYSKDWKLIRSINLGFSGGVCEVRSIDVPDMAHGGVLPPLQI